MNGSSSGTSTESVEKNLRDELAKSDVSLVTTRPVLCHLLASDAVGLYSDEVVAKVRGMVSHLARQVLFEEAKNKSHSDRGAFADQYQTLLTQHLLDESSLLGCVHALALEAIIAERISARSGTDAVLSPLVQEALSASKSALAKSAMRVLAVQARFMQQQKRMELPLAELPRDVADTLCEKCSEFLSANFEDTETDLAEYFAGLDRNASRIEKIADLLNELNPNASRALQIDHAGVSIFVSALEIASEQLREVAVMALSANQSTRLGLMLRATGLSAQDIDEQIRFLNPEIALPDGIDAITAAKASSLLRESHDAIERLG